MPEGRANLLLAYQHHLVNDLGEELESFINCQWQGGIAEGRLRIDPDRLSGIETGFECRAGLGLDRYDSRPGLGRLDGAANAGNQATPTDGNVDRVDLGKILEDLQSDRAIAGDGSAQGLR